MNTVDIRPGDVWWAELSPTIGREQAGRRPVVVISNTVYNRQMDSLALVVPVTTTNRQWANHVPLMTRPALGRESYAMTEQTRTVSRARLVRRMGEVNRPCLLQIRAWLRDFIDDELDIPPA